MVDGPIYGGPIIDAFFHAPWIGGSGAPRADDVPWTDDRRPQRVMKTFHHDTEPGQTVGRIDLQAVHAEMDTSGVSNGILAAKVYYPTTIDRLNTLHAELSRLSAASAGRPAALAGDRTTARTWPGLLLGSDAGTAHHPGPRATAWAGGRAYHAVALGPGAQ